MTLHSSVTLTSKIVLSFGNKLDSKDLHSKCMITNHWSGLRVLCCVNIAVWSSEYYPDIKEML